MAKVALFLIDGFEETEALATVDILRRGEVDVTTVSLTGKERVMGKHSVPNEEIGRASCRERV